MYTMTSYEGVIRGRETKDAIVHGGKCLRLLNGRLKLQGIGTLDEIGEGTIATVSCLAMVEVSNFTFVDYTVQGLMNARR